MPHQGYKDCLKQVGLYWHYRFSVSGKTFRGSTKSTSRAEALKFVQDLRALQVLESKFRPNPQYLFIYRSLKPTLPYLNIPVVKTPGSDPAALTVAQARTRQRVQLTGNVATITLSNLKAFLDALDSLKEIPAQVALAIRTMLFMGLRIQEVCEMRWDLFGPNFDRYNPLAHMMTGSTPIPLTLDMANRFQQWKATSESMWTAQGKQVPAWVFWDQNGCQRSKTFTTRWIKVVAAGAGLEGNWYSHRLRCSYAALLSEVGAPAHIMRRLMRVRTSGEFSHFSPTKEQEFQQMREALALVCEHAQTRVASSSDHLQGNQ